ncbi:unnamed protein product [Caenorhabditis auriculariae]|uniref:Uncharacterized protein n=1 Tax=Caenorhabditis auriculariae TaxID=2777116 RepID=A0A8S1HEE9_9PELO|nr:unnamed protein product [Caenorhabditis auriculariae]
MNSYDVNKSRHLMMKNSSLSRTSNPVVASLSLGERAANLVSALVSSNHPTSFVPTESTCNNPIIATCPAFVAARIEQTVASTKANEAVKVNENGSIAPEATTEVFPRKSLPPGSVVDVNLKASYQLTKSYFHNPYILVCPPTV